MLRPEALHRRPLRRTAVLLAAVAAALAGSLSASAATEARSAPRSCPADSNPYTSSSGVVATCHYVVYKKLTSVATSFGGTKTTYASGATHFTILTPPKTFDMATASPALLTDYGMPPEPPASSPAARAEWVQMATDGKSIAIPSALYGPPPGVHFGNDLGINYNTTWSGYLDFLPTGAAGNDGEAVADYVEPTGYSSSCSGTAMGIWDSLGGAASGGAFVQAGTTIGDWHLSVNGKSIVPNEAWAQFDATAQYTLLAPEMATPGQIFESVIQHLNKNQPLVYHFYWYNAYTHLYASADGTEPNGYKSSGATAGFIVERAQGGTLENFKTMKFTWVGVESNNEPITAINYEEPEMWSKVTGSPPRPASGAHLLATNSALSSSGHQFSVTQDHCS